MTAFSKAKLRETLEGLFDEVANVTRIGEAGKAGGEEASRALLALSAIADCPSRRWRDGIIWPRMALDS